MSGSYWHHVFQAWPAEMARRGILVTSFDEQIPFSGFMVGEELLMLARSTPDALGARAVLLPYENIAAVKFVDVVKSKPLNALGLQGDLEKKGSP